jgi:CRP/FNR family transcriptional regulator
VRDACVARGLAKEDMAGLFDIRFAQQRLKAGHALYRAGDAFDAIYAVRAGFLKSGFALEDGRHQVTGFHMAGEIVGLDGMGTGQHCTDVRALEDSYVCVIPHQRLRDPALQPLLRKAMALELVRGQGAMLLLGTMSADERLAVFLLNLSQRFLARGFAPSDFHLRMTRGEIASYLGLKMETVSRLFSQFRDEGFIAVQQKHIRILDAQGLRTVVGRVTA